MTWDDILNLFVLAMFLVSIVVTAVDYYRHQ